MYAFRQRPLTWLFWIATACASLVGVVRYPESEWLGALLFAQLYVISGWAAISEVHRLGRGATLVIGPLALAAVVFRSQRAADEASHTLAFALVMAGLVFAATRVLVLLLRMPQAQRREADGKRWQISIVEMFGWTIVVAVSSWAVSLAKLPKLEHFHALWPTLFSSIPAAMLMAMFLAPRRHHDRVSLVLVLVGLLTFFAAAGRWDYLDRSDHMLFASLFAYTAFWVLVVRLDENAALRPEGPPYDSPGHSPG